MCVRFGIASRSIGKGGSCYFARGLPGSGEQEGFTQISRIYLVAIVRNIAIVIGNSREVFVGMDEN
ncbi:MAG TPA: hypothetical protein VGK10_08285 [Prolixibacteraceae bacterium]